MAGRKTKLTPALTQEICNGIRIGLTYELSCQLAGVGYSTFMRWKKQAEDAKSGRLREFGDAIKRANVEARAFHLKNIVAQAKGGQAVEEVHETVKRDERTGEDVVTERRIIKKVALPVWQCSAWILERRFPVEWGRHIQPRVDDNNQKDPFERWVDDLMDAEGKFGAPAPEPEPEAV